MTDKSATCVETGSARLSLNDRGPYQHGTMAQTAEFLAKFWGSVDKSEGCWLWRGGSGKGYGSVHVRGLGAMAVHRAALELAVGPLKAGQLACHACNTPRCVRVGPGHLYVGTAKDNARDRLAAGTQRGGRGR